jgi:hypothetical protein
VELFRSSSGADWRISINALISPVSAVALLEEAATVSSWPAFWRVMGSSPPRLSGALRDGWPKPGLSPYGICSPGAGRIRQPTLVFNVPRRFGAAAAAEQPQGFGLLVRGLPGGSGPPVSDVVALRGSQAMERTHVRCPACRSALPAMVIWSVGGSCPSCGRPLHFGARPSAARLLSTVRLHRQPPVSAKADRR